MEYKKRVILFCEISWNFLEQRHHHLARYFAEDGYDVIFVERVISRVPSVKEFFRLVFSNVAQIKSVNKKPPQKGVELRKSYFLPATNTIFRLWNYGYWRLCWKEKQKESLVYSFVDNPDIIGDVKDEVVEGRISVFDIIHNWWQYPWDNCIHARNANRCVNIFGRLVTDSALLKDEMQVSFANKDFHLMLPGVSRIWHSRSSRGPTRTDKIIVTFFGNLRMNSDLELVQQFTQDSRYQVNFFGLVDKTISFRNETVRFHGVQSSDIVADFCAGSDIVLLPYKSDPFSLTISPAKYFECLATGSLVVSRANLSHLPGWCSYVIRVESFAEFHGSIGDLLEKHEMCASSQLKFVESHSWSNRFQNLSKFIYSAVESDKGYVE